MSGPHEEPDSKILDDLVKFGGYCIQDGLHSYEAWANHLRQYLGQESNPKFDSYLKETWRRLLPLRRELISPPPPLDHPSSQKAVPTQPRAAYEFSRLCFRKDVIEWLSPSDEFRVITPAGTFQMSKAQFYEAFPNVVQSRSYQEGGIYHYPTVPEKARRFLLESPSPVLRQPARPNSIEPQRNDPDALSLQNRYVIVRQLGQGGMGTVYEAFDSRLTRTVALKKTFAETEELRRAFEREARLLANLNHPSLPRVIDHFTEGQEQYLVMDYIPGDDLKTLIEKRGKPFSPEEVMRLANDLLETLEYLHGYEPPIIHRDIKPANLKFTNNGKVVLLDFGLAKGTAGQMPSVTDGRSIFGFSPYFAPLEQMQGERTTVRSDLYSLAATLYYLLTGVVPPDALMRAALIIDGEPDPLTPVSKFRSDAPENLVIALTKALSLRQAQRPESAAELRSILNRGKRNADTSIGIDADEHNHTPEEASSTSEKKKDPFEDKSFYGWIAVSTVVFGVVPFIAGASISTILLFAVVPAAALISLAALGLCLALIEEKELKKTSALLAWALLFSVVAGLYFLTNVGVSAVAYPILTYCLIALWMKIFLRK